MIGPPGDTFKDAGVLPPDIVVRRDPDGTIRAHSPHQLGPYPERLTEKLDFWAALAPERCFLAERDTEGAWTRLTYGEARARVRRIANHGQSERYTHVEIGTNSRLDSLQAAVLNLRLALLDADNARKLSPAFMTPATRAPVMSCVGGAESSEFQRQNALLGERWRAAFAGDIAMPGKNHFSVIDGLADQKSPLFAGARRLMKLDK